MRSFFRNNGLSLVLLAFFLVTLIAGQTITGLKTYNDERLQHGKAPITYGEYLSGSHFIEATAENWESEFLQLFVYIVLTKFLYQRGSAESKDPEHPEQEEQPVPRTDAPPSIRRCRFVAAIYAHSLSIAFFVLFMLSFLLHAFGGAGEYNEIQLDHGQEQVSMWKFMTTSEFWFQSFQNWQSEFFAVWAVVVFTIFMREKGSAQSKSVDAPHGQTGR